MTKTTFHFYKFLTLCMVMLTAILTVGCSMMEEDLPECITQVRVSIKYDYNIDRADMFHDQVGEVRLFVIDYATNNVVRDTIVSNRDNFNAIRENSDRYFTVVFTDLPGNRKYTFMAMALQRPYDETMQHAADKFVGTFPKMNASKTDFNVHLTHNGTPDERGLHKVTAPDCGLDTLWMGHTTTPITVPEDPYSHIIVCDTVSMVRDTKYLDIALFNLDDDKKAQMRHEDYRIEIEDNNCQLAWDNELIKHAQLLYTPHAQWTVENLDAEGNVERTSARYEISFSRLMASGIDPTKAAKLRIIRNSDNELIANLNLPSYLAAGRSAYSWYFYSEQEYLDREHDYKLDLFLKGDSWLYLNVKVNITPWVIRRDNIWL